MRAKHKGQHGKPRAKGARNVAPPSGPDFVDLTHTDDEDLESRDRFPNAPLAKVAPHAARKRGGIHLDDAANTQTTAEPSPSVKRTRKNKNVANKNVASTNRDAANPALDTTSEEPVRDCVLCCKTLRESQFQSATPRCPHGRDVCVFCLVEYIKGEVEAGIGAVREIRCPLDCGVVLKPEEVRSFGGPRLFKRYNQITSREAIKTMDAFQWCLQPGCGSGQLYESDCNQPNMRCLDCQRDTCTTCQIPWHEGRSCREYRATGTARWKTRRENASRAYLAGTTRVCPKCETRIERDGGCFHMICSRCQHQFCWVCLAQFPAQGLMATEDHESDCGLVLGHV